MVTVLPITHSPPGDPTLAVELPAATKRGLGLDEARNWVVLHEANRFVWPGPDLRPDGQGSVDLGNLPYVLFEEVRLKFMAAVRARLAVGVRRSE